MRTAGGLVSVNVYDVQFVFILGAKKSDSQGNLAQGQGEVLGQIRAPEFEPGDNPFQALIGRDILRRGVLNLSFDGHYSFSY